MSILWPGLAGALAATLAAILFLLAHSSAEVLAVLGGVAVAVAVAARFGFLARIETSFRQRERTMNAVAIACVAAVALWYFDEPFNLLMIATVLVYVIASLGLNVQFGYAGVVNFAGAAFLGIGGYTAAVLVRNTGIPHILVIFLGGAMAALIGSLLIWPVLRTRGHYAALVTIAFGLLFKTFLEVNDVLGGPQGLKVPGLNLFGWRFNRPIEITEEIEAAFYLNYVILGLVLAVLAFTVVRRLERSWIGLNLDAIRLDETAAACFGLEVARWKVTAFTVGNFLIGMAGALLAIMLGFIAPNNFTFGDSLILVSIVLLGGIGNPWGLVLATVVVVVLPEKFQAIQEYRFLLYAVLVILILLFRPEGLLPRRLRVYLPGRAL